MQQKIPGGPANVAEVRLCCCYVPKRRFRGRLIARAIEHLMQTFGYDANVWLLSGSSIVWHIHASFVCKWWCFIHKSALYSVAISVKTDVFPYTNYSEKTTTSIKPIQTKLISQFTCWRNEARSSQAEHELKSQKAHLVLHKEESKSDYKLNNNSLPCAWKLLGKQKKYIRTAIH